MKAFKILQHIEKNGLDNSNFTTFKPNPEETAVDFVKAYFGGDFITGMIYPEKNYIAFWNGFQLPGIPDATIRDSERQCVFIYEVE